MKVTKKLFFLSMIVVSNQAHAGFDNDYFGCGLKEDMFYNGPKLSQLADEKGRTVVPVPKESNNHILAEVFANIITLNHQDLKFEVALRSGAEGAVRIENRTQENIWTQTIPKVFDVYARGWKDSSMIIKYEGKSYKEKGYTAILACYRGEKETLSQFFEEYKDWY